MRASDRTVEGVKKIAVLRLGGLGDFIFALPALSALRGAYPDAEISLLAADWHQELLANRPGPVDRVIVVPVSRGVRGSEETEEDPKELDGFFSEMVEEKFDMALQFHGGGRFSNPFVRRLKARLTAGAKSLDAAPLDRTIPYHLRQMETLRFLEIAGLVGAQAVHLEPYLTVTYGDIDESRGAFPETEKQLVVLHPGVTIRRRWPVERFAAVGEKLAEAGVQVAVTGTKAEKEIVDGVVSAMASNPINLSGCLSLSGLTGLLSRCTLLISNDSGPLHLARAVGAATVGIYWGPNLINAGPATRARNHPVISWCLNCPACGADVALHDACGHAASLVEDVPVEEVASSALNLLALPQLARSDSSVSTPGS